MKKINTILLISILISLPASVFALENQYPILPGTSNPTTLIRFINYLFVSMLFLGLMLAVLQLTLAGAKFIWLSHDPKQIQDAKDQAKRALLGLAILLGSFLILRTINPNLINLSFTPLKSFPKTWPPPGPQDKIFRGDLMERIKIMAEELKILLSDQVKKTSQDIKKASEDCSCSGATSVCSCDQPGQGAICAPKKCYLEPESHPCKDPAKMKENQMRIVFFGDVILYYKNRAEKEVQDLQENIKVIDKKLEWYQDSIKIAKENEAKAKNYADKNFWQKLGQDLRKEYEKSLNEKGNKLKTSQLIEWLKNDLDQFSAPLLKITELPEKCVSDVENKCQPVCKDKREQGYGCYEAVLGCQPDKCQGGNPCPQEEINSTEQSINDLVNKTEEILNQIIQIINSMKQV